MVWVLLVAVLFILVRSMEWMWLVFAPFGLIIAFYAWSNSRHKRRGPLWSFLIAAVLANVINALLAVYVANFLGYMLMAFVLISFLPISIGCGLSWSLLVTHPKAINRRSPLLVWSLMVALCFTPLTMQTELWPLQLAFRVSRPALNALADRVISGSPVVRPERAGLYLVVGSMVNSRTGEVGLIIDATPGFRSAFVRLSPVVPNVFYVVFTHLSFEKVLDKDWLYQNE